MRARNTKSVKQVENVTPNTLPFSEKYTPIQNGFQDGITTGKETIDEIPAVVVQEGKHLKRDSASIDDDNVVETKSKHLGTSVMEVGNRNKCIYLS